MVYEIFIILFIIMIFFFMLGAEIKCMIHNGKPNFFYDVYVNKYLKKNLNNSKSNEEILDLIYDETKDKHLLIWRHVIFVSFSSSLLATFIVKIIYRNIDFNIFIILFLSLFFSLMLFLSLVNFHFYGSKNDFILECILKIKENSNTTEVPN